ncbi:MAG TPA: acyl carrier protein [Symbiobacteriaceae bacterium]|nr:acyl carrier protein [Symbiobacteriaceae bacterium]
MQLMQGSAERMEARLAALLAAEIGIGPDDVDVRLPFACYGLDSRAAVTMSGTLEDMFGITLSPTVLWDYPTIEQLAAYLAESTAPAVHR